MPSIKQMEKMASACSGHTCSRPRRRSPARVLAFAPGRRCRHRQAPASATAALPLSEIPHHLLRVGCRRCSRTVEIQKVDAIRLYGQQAIWKDVGQRLWTIPVRSGRAVMRKTAAGRTLRRPDGIDRTHEWRQSVTAALVWRSGKAQGAQSTAELPMWTGYDPDASRRDLLGRAREIAAVLQTLRPIKTRDSITWRRSYAQYPDVGDWGPTRLSNATRSSRACERMRPYGPNRLDGHCSPRHAVSTGNIHRLQFLEHPPRQPGHCLRLAPGRRQSSHRPACRCPALDASFQRCSVSGKMI
jgi:hypothetical protein